MSTNTYLQCPIDCLVLALRVDDRLLQIAVHGRLVLAGRTASAQQQVAARRQIAEQLLLEQWILFVPS